MKSLFTILTLITFLYSCRNTEHLTKRYESITYTSNDTEVQRSIGVSAYVLNKESEAKTPKTIFDLSPKAQAALLMELGKKDSTSEKLISDLGAQLSAKTNNTATIVDYTKIERKIVVSVSQLLPDQGDRIDKITISVDFDSALKIIGCNKLATEYETIDYGKLTYSSTQSGEINGSLSTEAGTEVTSEGKTATAKTTAGVTGKYGTSKTFSEEVTLKERIASFASIRNDDLFLSLQGAEDRTLEGNIIAEVTFEVETSKVEKVYAFGNMLKNDEPLGSDGVKVSEKLLLLPDLTSDIKAQLCFDADYWHVKDNADTKTESDDDVELFSGKQCQGAEVIVLRKKDLQPKIWKLCYTSDTARIPIQIINPSTGKGDLLFDSYEEAQNFVYWLKTCVSDPVKTILIGSRKHTINIPNEQSLLNITILPYNF